jgi:hypothetical protein
MGVIRLGTGIVKGRPSSAIPAAAGHKIRMDHEMKLSCEQALIEIWREVLVETPGLSN